MKRIMRTVWCGLLLAFVACADEIKPEDAETAARNWIHSEVSPLGTRMGKSVSGIQSFADVDGTPLFHLAALDGGGFVILSADDGMEPVLAFSDKGTFSPSEDNALWVLLHRDLPLRTGLHKRVKQSAKGTGTANPHQAAWQRLLGDSNGWKYALKTTGEISDLRIAPLLKTEWGQTTDDGYEEKPNLYNLYTPENSPCGCVATAGAQIMRFFQWPTGSLPRRTFLCLYETLWERTPLMLKTYGGPYAWTSMPERPAATSPQQSQREAIAKLVYDVGISCMMAYSQDGSGAGLYMLADSLTDYFQYAQAKGFCIESGTFSESVIQRAVLANLDARLPVALGITAPNGYGHAVVADGYGYIGSTRYVHINIGYDGDANAWYNLPDLSFSLNGANYPYKYIDQMVYNIHPSRTGEIVSGRVLLPNGVPAANVVVTIQCNGTSQSVTADKNGIWWGLVESNSSGTASYSDAAYYGSCSFSVAASVSVETTEDGFYTPKSGSVGNSWGNTIQLSILLTPAYSVEASQQTSAEGIEISWQRGRNAVSQAVYRALAGDFSAAHCLAEGLTDASSYFDTTAVPGVQYTYWIQSNDAYGNTAFSEGVVGIRAYPPGVEQPLFPEPLNSTRLKTKGTYSGFFYGSKEVDGETANAIQGTLTLKVTNVKTGKSTVQLVLEGRKLSLHASAWKSLPDVEGTRTLLFSGKNNILLRVNIREERMWGTLTGKGITGELPFDGARNFFVETANKRKSLWKYYQGTWTMAMETQVAAGSIPASYPWGYSVFSLKVAAKGKVTMRYLLADGSKGSVTSQLLLLDTSNVGTAFVPLFLQRSNGKKGVLGAGLWLNAESRKIDGEGWWKNPLNTRFQALLVAIGKINARPYAKLSMDLEQTENLPPYKDTSIRPLDQLLPIGEKVSVSGNRCTIAKQVPVKVAKDGTLTWGKNPAGLKLSYTYSTGIVKGSFYVYYLVKGKPSKVKATLSGIALNNGVQGWVTVKDVSSGLKMKNVFRSLPFCLYPE
ncbi:MAG: C10 family peptidase [Kiritimatiellae bacterium]|nr:C10 family peptidase [Kiritimatiellia bacterium]